MILIGAAHQCRSGKSTMCDYLVEHYGFVKMSFAEALYEECRKLFMVVRQDVYPPDHWNNEKGRNWDYSGMTDKDPMLLQWWGTNVRRKQNENYWVDKMRERLNNLHSHAKVCIDDVRFKNEARFISEKGGYVVKIDRPNRPIDRDPTHPSEIDLIDYPFGHVIENTGTLEEFYSKVDDWASFIGLVRKER